MKNAEIKVLAECVDHRSGKRYFTGDVFNPLPTEEQAERLVAAKCLPKEAIEIARKNDAAVAEAREKAESDAKKRQASAAAVTAANTELAEARSAADTAQNAFDAADEAAKVAASAELEKAKSRLAAAEDQIKKLSK